MSESRELELKLEVRPRQLSALRSRSVRQFGEAASRERITSTYFDTAAHHLREKGLTLRVRQDGSRFVQTVKRVNGALGAGMFDRSEWESDVPGQEPDLAAAEKSPVAEVISGREDELRPVFRSEIERTIWLVEHDGATIEVALDAGRVATDGSNRPLGELELELKTGEPAALFALARKLDGTGTLRLGVLTKSEQGYRLAAGEDATSHKAGHVGLTRGMTTGDAVSAIVRACIRHFRLNEPAMTEERAPEALHQARVAIRRLRSALSLFRDLFGDPETEAIKTRLRALAALLGNGRNLDVYLERLEAAPDGDPPPSPEWVAKLRTDREAAYDEIGKALSSRRFRGLMLDLLIWAEDGEWRRPADPDARHRLEQPIEEVAAEILRKRRRRVRRRGEDLAGIDPEERHQVRIEAKKLRYASDFFSGLVERKTEKRRLKAFLSALEALQGALGDLNDLETARALHAEHPESEPAGPTDDDGARERELIAEAVAAHRSFVDAKPFWRDFA